MRAPAHEQFIDAPTARWLALITIGALALLMVCGAHAPRLPAAAKIAHM